MALLVILVPASGRPAMIAAGITGLVAPGSKSAADWSWILNILEQSTAKALQGRRGN